MNDCHDKSLQTMLHHYELGLLSDSDRARFEQHLLECDSCFEQAMQSKDAARLMKTDPAVREVIAASSQIKSEPKRSWREGIIRPGLVRGLLIAASILLVVVLVDWQFGIKTSHEAVAGDNRLAVMYFQNLADPDDAGQLGEIAASLLITDLSQSRFLQVVSSQRLYDVLRLTGHEGRKAITPDLANEITAQTDSRWVLLGTIIQMTPTITLSVQLIDTQTGLPVATEEITGQEGDDIFAVIDRLSIRVKQNLPLPADALSEPDIRVANVTTTSQEAYRHYLRGLEQSYRVYNEDAAASFREAISYDSTFAMAYYYLASLEDRKFIEQAALYSDNASPKEQLYIKSLQAGLALDNESAVNYLLELLDRYPDEKDAMHRLGMYYHVMGRFRDAVDVYHHALEIDPNYKMAFNQLAYDYREVGRIDSALWAIDRYIALAPNEANPYDTRGDLYAANGDLDEAIESFRRALENKPDFKASLEKLGHMYVFKGDYAAADSIYRLLIEWDDSITRSMARQFRAYIPLSQGKLSVALEILTDAMGQGLFDGGEGVLADMHRMKALILAEQQQWDAALAEVRQAMVYIERYRPSDRISYRDVYIRLLAESGDLAAAEEAAVAFKLHLDSTEFSLQRYWFSVAVIEWQKGNLAEATAYLDNYNAEKDSYANYGRRYQMAKIFFESGRLADAVDEFESLSTIYECAHLYWGSQYIQMPYYLGRAYEESRWYDRAIEQYELFLSSWRDSGHPLPTVADAEERLARLRSKP